MPSNVQRSSGSSLSPVVSVLTPTIKGREAFLAECRASVLVQTFPDWEHLRLLDEHRVGCAATMNALAAEADGDWVLPLADDDLILPGCLAALLAVSDDADVVYSPPLVWGVENPWWFFQEPPAIPSFGLIRRELWEKVGGYDYLWNREEDRRFWTRAVELGARFVKAASAPTWVYRIHQGSKSFHDGGAA